MWELLCYGFFPWYFSNVSMKEQHGQGKWARKNSKEAPGSLGSQLLFPYMLQWQKWGDINTNK